ncbi:MAG TPA: zf-HC2 domain-containing protein [Pyrinomonadaceae bacterium]|nr:zf-HC2 domain-containing protein [Pyrinomonadaceae bacterium]
MSNSNHTCQTENIAAYIDGDLEPALRAALEEHIKQCAACASELQAQRVFMCELDSALASPFDLAVPVNFAQVVAVNAESDMRGVRSRAEHTRALRYCIVLGLAAFALLGFASSKAIVLNFRAAAAKVFGVLAFFTKTIFDAAVGFAVISRVVSRGVLAGSLAGFAGLLLVVLAIAVLSLLISRYHRARVLE